METRTLQNTAQRYALKACQSPSEFSASRARAAAAAVSGSMPSTAASAVSPLPCCAGTVCAPHCALSMEVLDVMLGCCDTTSRGALYELARRGSS
jgi:hypothetical protein